MAAGIAGWETQRWSGKIPISRKERREPFGKRSLSAKQLMKALVAYTGLDAPPNDSGDLTGRHKSMSKIGAKVYY